LEAEKQIEFSHYSRSANATANFPGKPVVLYGFSPANTGKAAWIVCIACEQPQRRDLQGKKNPSEEGFSKQSFFLETAGSRRKSILRCRTSVA
jgi:hypothetical protein